MTGRLRHLLLSVLIALAPGPPGGGLVVAQIVAQIAAVSAGTLIPTPATAQSSRRSGGYGLPSRGGSFAAPSRRPSVSGGYGSSGGYSAPGGYGTGRAPVGGYGGGDRAISRQSSGQALQQYRTSQQPPPERRPSTGYADPWSGGDRRPTPNTFGGGFGSSGGGYAPVYGGGGYGRGYPSYVPTQRFGVWDGLMLWGLLNTLSQPGRSQFFYSNQNDPAYQQWRAQMNAAAAQDPAVRQKLAELDAQVAQLQGQPRTPGVLPADVRAPNGPNSGAGVPSSAANPGTGGSLVFIVLFLGAGLFVLLWVWRRRGAPPATPGAPVALGGSERMRFRVGMTFPVDPTPFILAAGSTKVTGIGGTGLISVEAVGVLMDGAIPLHRLYLPGRTGFFQLHLGRDGQADECRYFSRLDEVSPASQDEWGVWLDPAQGLIGWPQFQTKDGKTYDRVWAAGGARVPPRDLAETIQDLSGTGQRVLHAMLYGAPTGAAPPAPQTEYILVAAVEDRGQAWVEIHAGIDVNPASLSLPAVPLA